MKDLYNNIKVTQVLNPVVATTTQTSSAIDLQGYNSLSVAILVGLSGDTLSATDYWTLKLQDSDDDVSYTDVAAADTHNGVASYIIDNASEDEKGYHFGYSGHKRYLKAVISATGTHTNGTPFGVITLHGNADYLPVT